MASNTLSPFAATFRRLTAFVNDNDLPEADITVRGNEIISIAFHTGELPENAFWRYAQALDLPVTVQPFEDADGCAAELLHCNGIRDGVMYICQWVRPVLAVVPA